MLNHYLMLSSYSFQQAKSQIHSCTHLPLLLLFIFASVLSQLDLCLLLGGEGTCQEMKWMTKKDNEQKPQY